MKGAYPHQPRDHEDEGYIGPPVLDPDTFDKIVTVLAKNNGAFNRNVDRLTINGVAIDRAPF